MKTIIALLMALMLNGAPSLAEVVKDSKELPGNGQKTNWYAQIHRSTDVENQIPDLVFSNLKFPVTLIQKDSKLRPLVTIKGSLKDKTAKLYLSDGVKFYPIDSKNDISVLLFLNSSVSELNLQLKKENGSVQNEKVTIVAPDIQEYRIGYFWGELVMYLGGGNLKYYQTTFGDFVSLTGLISASYRAPVKNNSKFSYFADLDVSVWTIHSSPTNNSPQLLKFQGNAAYSVLSPESAFSLHPLLGVQYLTLLSNGSKFGFKNLIAPEIGLRSLYKFKGESSLLLHFAYQSYDSLTNFSKVGTDLLLLYSKMLNNRHRLEFGTGYWNNSYSATSSTEVKAGFLYFKLGYSI